MALVVLGLRGGVRPRLRLPLPADGILLDGELHRGGNCGDDVSGIGHVEVREIPTSIFVHFRGLKNPRETLTNFVYLDRL